MQASRGAGGGAPALQSFPIPGPSTRTKKPIAIAAPTIHGMLHVIPSGVSVAYAEGGRGIAGYHASNEVPPSEAAAAEISTTFIPRGLSSPVAISVTAPATEGRSDSRLARA